MHNDYIMRMIELFFRALARIIHSRKMGNYEDAYKQIQNASQRYLKEDISALAGCTPEQILNYFRLDCGSLDIDRCIICGDLLYELALISEEKRQNDLAIHLKNLCLNLYISSIPLDKKFHSYNTRVETLIEEIKNSSRKGI